MDDLRHRTVAILTISANELGSLAEIHRGHDNAAVEIDLTARLEIIKCRDEYANGAPAPLERSAAEAIRELSAALEHRSKSCANVHAAADLKHESERLSHFLVTTGVDVDSSGYVFQLGLKQPSAPGRT